jgi:hypothetical protein
MYWTWGKDKGDKKDEPASAAMNWMAGLGNRMGN